MSLNYDFFQLFEAESSTYTYIIADRKAKIAVVIDPVLETIERDLKFIEELGVKVKYILDTHVHADHITAAGKLRAIWGSQTAVSKYANVECADLKLEDGQILHFGDLSIKAMTTPGHTDSCMSFYFDNKVFTGDVLLIRGSGRTDFQQGSPDKMFHSVHTKIFSLPDETIVYPAHDYKGFTSSTVGLEKKFNPRLKLTNSLADFTKIMSELKLAYPKKIDHSLPANMSCGIVRDVPLIEAKVAFQSIAEFKIIDVRRPDEFNGELGHIKGAYLATLGEELSEFLKTYQNKNEKVVLVCRSGGRSGKATEECLELGFTNVYNLKGGMLEWNEQKLPIVKE